MFEIIVDYWSDVTTSFLDPKKRVFVGYLFSAFVIALLWLVCFKRRKLFSSVKLIFSKKVWLSNSSKVDYKIFLINKLLFLLISPLLIAQLVLATTIFYWLYDVFPSRPIVFEGSPAWVVIVLFTLGYFLLDDFARFYVHRLMHRWPLLWSFHKVHHTAETLTPMTVFRTHPIESLIFSLRSTVVQAIAISGFIFFMGDRANLLTVLGVNAFVFGFNLVGSNLRHSHIGIYYWKAIEKLLISPAQHQIHHSLDERHWNKNYGVVLAIWDWMFGSHCHSEKEKHLLFGIDSKDKNAAHSLKGVYITPFYESFAVLKKYSSVASTKIAGFYKGLPHMHWVAKD